MKLMTLKTLCNLVLLAGLSSACSDDGNGAPHDGSGGGQGGGTATSMDPDPVDAEKMAEISVNYATIVHATYMDSLTSAQALDDAIAALVAEPSEDNLSAAREAWLASREPYLQSETFRFYDGPIDNPSDGPEGLINAWPLDENFIDYTADDAEAGIINDPESEISAEALVALNEQGGEKNIATGYHAIEFLLWGQDLSADGPGDRPLSDYADGTPAAERRGQYLTTVSALLVSHLEGLVEAWEPGAENYRAEFEAAEPDEQLRRILTGMITLSGFETGGERLQAALDTGDQEDEHSCFSDNTHRDMIQDVQGIQNVYLGTYTNLDGDVVGDGSGVLGLVQAADATLAEELEERIATSLSLANELEVPFDQGIALGNTAGRDKVQALITSLRSKQEKLLEQVFTGFGLNIPEPE